MSVSLGDNEIRDIRIGATPVQTVHKGSELIWTRATLESYGDPVDHSHNGGTAYAEQTLYLDPAPSEQITWSYVVNSSSGAPQYSVGVQSSGHYNVTMYRQWAGSSTANITVTATVGGTSWSKTFNLYATVSW